MVRRALVKEALTRSVIGCFFAVYNTLKFGLLESLYSRALELELVGRRHRVTREFGVRVSYKGMDIGLHRLDLVVDDRLHFGPDPKFYRVYAPNDREPGR
jgi:GxxExxY protein